MYWLFNVLVSGIRFILIKFKIMYTLFVTYYYTIVCHLLLHQNIVDLSHFLPQVCLYTRYPIVARAWPLGRVRAQAQVSCIQQGCHKYLFASAVPQVCLVYFK